MSAVELFIVFAIVIILAMYINNYVNAEVEYIKSKVDGRSYLVRSLPDKQEAADYLARINADLQKLVRHLRAKYPNDADYKRMYENFDPDAISEGSPESNYTSYTVNKTALVICIRQVDHSFVKKNVVMYLVLHEMGHMACPEVGHTPMFWDVFKKVLREAVKMGLYSKIDFKNKPEPYCGISIRSSVI